MSTKVVRLKPYVKYAVVRTDSGGAYIETAEDSLMIYETWRLAKSALNNIRSSRTPAENRRLGTLRIAQLLTAEVECGNE